jgi:hypothetical protein
VNLVLNGVTSRTSMAVGGGGCISVMHKGNVSESRVTIDGNSLESCSVQMDGLNPNQGAQGIQYGNTYGHTSRRQTHVTSGRSPSPNRRSLYRELGSDVYKTAEGRRSNSRALTHGALGVERGVVAPLSRGKTFVTRGSYN